MIPIEVFFSVIVLIFGLIGMARGFLRELGVTIALILVLFVLNQFGDVFNRGFDTAFAMSNRFLSIRNENLIKCWIYLFIIVGVTFISYHGETLAFSGQLPRGSQVLLLGGLTGLLNGYLIAGSIWHYMNVLGYPIKLLGYTPDRLSGMAQGMLRFLPIPFLGHEFFFGQSLLLYLLVALVIARLIR